MKYRAFHEEKSAHFEFRCRQHGLPLTIQRRAVLEHLAGRADHPTADQIYAALLEQLRGISRATVYRVLETLVSIGVIQKISNPGAKARFDADTKRHHHLVCLACEAVIDFHDRQLNNLSYSLGDHSTFEVKDYSVVFTGYCSGCRRETMS